MEMTPDEVVTELELLTNANPSLALVLVEGETDQALYSSLISEAYGSSVMFFATGSRSLLTKSLSIINQPGLAGLPPTIGIIDQDYLIPLGEKIPTQNIFLTDLRDVECMMIASEAMKVLCEEYIDWKKTGAAGLPNATEIRKALVKSCVPLGELRYWSQSTKKHYIFRKLDLSGCLDKAGTRLDCTKIHDKLRGAQKPGNSIPPDAFVHANMNVASNAHFSSELLICRGHDLAEVFSAQLRKRWGRAHAKTVDASTIERSLRLAFPRFWSSFQQIKDIKHWFTGAGLGYVLAP
ncbi:hypothetical protein AVMA1855_06715 [Acidovorax sp. SUPP1855]|uniref:DUF4435 domain-containing protein n=1 Tax=Acidovorax sp. SUPP1855 TaxID=431774 RepID=UPI0023DE4132|nr:DUF4435 domain-containing protein [Acidovorax sp. SUPP1855]GKS83817.1 hypothetical protein AVMA1855_06715 [Acidovorax sp. SUPP1855]